MVSTRFVAFAILIYSVMDLPIQIPILKIVMGAILFLIIIGLRIAREYECGVIFRLGRYVGIRGPGLYWFIPLGIERSILAQNYGSA